MNWLKFKWADLKLRWQLARHGEVMVLNAIDAIQAAQFQLEDTFPSGPPSPLMARFYLDTARAHLKQLINYEDEPEMVYPDDEYEANAMTPAKVDFGIDSSIHATLGTFQKQEKA